MTKTIFAVTYTGREAPFIERNYGSGLSFDPGQSRAVPEELAVKLLRHADVFEPAKATAIVTKTKVPTSDDTDSVLLEAKALKTKLDLENNQRQDVVDQVNLMDKDALKDYAHIKYGQPLAKTLTVENMRAKVVGLIDQFGLV